MKHRALVGALACGTIMAAGCGGGGERGSLDQTPVQAGSVSAQGTNLTTVAAVSNGATAYAIAGNLSKAVFMDHSPTLDETEIVFCEERGGALQIVAVAPDGTDKRVVAANAVLPASKMQVNSAATWVYYSAPFSPPFGGLIRVPYGGGSASSVLSDCADFALSPDGAFIVYRKVVHDGWWVAAADGSSPALMVDSTSHAQICGFISNTICRLYNAGPPAQIEERVIPAGYLQSTAETSSITVSELRLTNDGQPMWGLMWDGGLWLFQTYASVLVDNNMAIKNTFASLEYAYDLSPSPDGTKVAIASFFGGQSVDITDGTSAPARVAASTKVHSVSWSPYIKRKVFVGEGKYASGAGAVVFSEVGSRLPCAVVVDATTRSSVAVTQISAAEGPNVILKLTCDNLTKADRTLGRNYGYSTILSGGSGIKGAFISFDKATGELSSFTTFATAPEAKATPQGVVLEGGKMLQHIRKDATLEQPQRIVL